MMHPQIGDDGEFIEPVDPVYSVYEPNRLELLLRRIPRAVWWYLFWMTITGLIVIVGWLKLPEAGA